MRSRSTRTEHTWAYGNLPARGCCPASEKRGHARVTVRRAACWAEEAGASFERAEAEGRAPEAADLWDEEGRKSWGSHIVNALKARALYQRNVHYLVREGEVVIIDTATGRVQPISRWTDGLHQARALQSLRPGLQLHLEHAVRIAGKLHAL